MKIINMTLNGIAATLFIMNITAFGVIIYNGILSLIQCLG